MDPFTFQGVIDLPIPWPVPSPSRFYQGPVSDYLLEFWWRKDGRLEGVLLNPEDDTLIVENRTAVIEVTGVGTAKAILTVTCSTQGFDFNINSRPAGQDEPTIHLERRDESKADPASLSSDEPAIASAIRTRKDRLGSYKSAGFSRKNLEARWIDLRRELNLIRAHLQALLQGDSDYIAPIAISLRKLIAKGKGGHLLQDCAAMREAILPVWTRPHPPANAWSIDQLGPSMHIEQRTASTSPTYFLTMKTDLDQWLETRAATLHGKRFSNYQLLAELADKIGAHIDMSNRDNIDLLEQTLSIERSALSQYMGIVGTICLELGEALQQGQLGELS